jgi:hypothetical protein
MPRSNCLLPPKVLGRLNRSVRSRSYRVPSLIISGEFSSVGCRGVFTSFRREFVRGLLKWVVDIFRIVLRCFL